ncbi:MAG: molybdopterin molybdotransferase MoeA [Rhodocyclaceae bacterium]
MLTFEEARQRLLDSAQAIGRTESLDLLAARGRVLAQPVEAGLDVPPMDNSAMDGYALRLADWAPDRSLPVSQRVPAGCAPAPLAAGTAARIFTGAPIPPGADVVVMQEQCEVDGAGVRITVAPRAGQNIRRAGSDIARGSLVCAAGERLDAPRLGLLASLGLPRVHGVAPLRVAVFFTGDELVEPGAPLGAGAIYNSNRYWLRAMLEAEGCAVTDLGVVRDDLAATRDALRQAAGQADLIMTCGGVSVGEEDHVKAAVQAEGALDTWQIAIKPGKPFAFGRVAQTPFIGLPGNPVSGLVTFVILVRAYLQRRLGMAVAQPVPFSLRADFDWLRPDPKRREFLRVRRNVDGGVELFPNQASGVLTSCAWADGLVDVPPGRAIHAGDSVLYLPFEG